MNDKTRREFLKSCFRIGGYAGIACLGMGAVEDARGWGILPAIVSSGGAGSQEPASYSDWDGVSEDSIVNGSDSAKIMLVSKFENPIASGNETGMSGTGLSGADLVLTQSGSVPGATGTGRDTSRLLSPGSTQFFNPTANAIAGYNGLNTWTLLIAGKDFGSVGATAYACYFHNASTSEFISIRFDTSNVMVYSGVYASGGYNLTGEGITGAIATTGAFWIMACCDGTTTAAGFIDSGSSGSGAHGQPTKLSDFNAADRHSNARAEVFSAAFITQQALFNLAGGSTMPGSVQYVIFANDCLIDLGA